jgi:4-amino-4-deoxy-L-arabinose transferase-like glycosyltransferase
VKPEMQAAPPSPHSHLITALLSLAIAVLALVPRAVSLGRFITIDESYHWFGRAQKFLDALRVGDWAATNLVGHPGVTTMWLGSTGLRVQEWLVAAGWLAQADFDTTRLFLRLPVAITTSLCVALGFVMLRKVLPFWVALLAALLWATDPFLVAHSQLLHVDALLTSFITLALLAALLAFRVEEASDGLRWGWLLVSAVCGGLGLLTKSPAIIGPGLVGLIGLAIALRRGAWGRVIVALLVWGGVAVAVWFALWPAAWVDPLGSLLSIIHQAESDGGSPHGWGNFFLGRAVDDPGPRFYPVALLLRLTPWALLGLLLLCAKLLWMAWHSRAALVVPRGQRTLLMLLLFVLLFGVMVSIPAKKFDRYALPIFPSLNILAAAGFAWKPRLNARTASVRAPRFMQAAAMVVLFVCCVGNLAWFHPYELSYYNPLFGGGAAAARLIPVGWGEGLEQAGAFITAQPDGNEQTVATWYRPALKPYINNTLVPLGDLFKPNLVGYAVLYIDQVQRRDDAAATDWLLANLQPIHTVRIHGIDYAEIYRVPRQPAVEHQADFGATVRFRGYDLDTSQAAQGTLQLTVHWQALVQPTSDLMLFVHILDATGQRIGGVDVPPGGSGPPTSQWQAGEYVSAVLQVPSQPLPEGAWIALGLYEPSGARLELLATATPDAPDDGPNALLLGPLP